MNDKLYIPNNFIEDVKSYLPSHLAIDDFIEYCKRPLRRSVRVNTLRMSVNDFKQSCLVRGWTIAAIPWCEEGFWLERTAEEEQTLPIGNTDLHLSGCIYVQEASSMLPPMALREALSGNPKVVLDVAAAPGSKTTQLAALMDNQGLLIANEFSSSRVKVLAANLKRMGVVNTALSHFDGAIFGDYMSECFDEILLDAPCSGEGTVRKDEHALKNWSIESNIDIAAVQKQLIVSAFHALKPGGHLVYSTCTLTPIENQQVCQYLLDSFPGSVEIVSLHALFEGAEKATTDEGYLHVWPQIFDSEGFFIAKFKKLERVENSNQKTKKGNFPFSPAPKKEKQFFDNLISNQFGLKTYSGNLYVRDKEVWLFPHEATELLEKIKYQRIGILVGTTHKNGIRLEHELATTFGHLATKNTYALSQSQAIEYFKGQDVTLEENTKNKGEVILTLCGAPIGLGKWQGHKIKNSLPRDLVQNGNLISWG